jgi:hypothetical protein
VCIHLLNRRFYEFSAPVTKACFYKFCLNPELLSASEIEFGPGLESLIYKDTYFGWHKTKLAGLQPSIYEPLCPGILPLYINRQIGENKMPFYRL